MEGVRLILNDGTVIENGRAGYSEGFLWLYLPMTMQEAAVIAFDPEKTVYIVFQYGEMQEEYRQFTVCTRLMAGEIETAVCMARGTD